MGASGSSLMKRVITTVLCVCLAFQLAPRAIAQGSADLEAQLMETLESRRRVAAAALESIDPALVDVEALGLALSFEDAAAIVDHVTSTIRYETYAGLLRGPQGTLVARAGNALDQSVLLANLLGDAGYQTRVALGRLDENGAGRLLASMFRPSGVTSASAPDERALADLASRAGVSQAELEQALRSRESFDLTTHPDYQRASSARDDILASLEAAGLAVGGDVTSDLLKEARDYAWVEYRLSADDPWEAAHPAFADQAPPEVSADRYLEGAVPAELTHRLRVEVFVERKLGERLETSPLMDPWEIPAANLFGMNLSIGNVPIGVEDGTTIDQLGTELADVTFYVPQLNGSLPPGAQAFDLLGNVVPPDVLGGGRAGVFQTEGERFGRAAGALGGMDGPATEEAVALTAEWIDFTLVGPNGDETRHRRFLFDRLTPRSRVDGGTDLQDKSVLLDGILTQFDFVVVSGGLSPDYVVREAAEQALNYVDVLERLMAAGPIPDDAAADAALTEILADLRVRAHLNLVAGFDAVGGTAPSPSGSDGGAVTAHAYRAQPTIVALEQAVTPGEIVTYEFGVDIVNNRRRFLEARGDQVVTAPVRAVLAGAWETALERALVAGLAGDGDITQGTYETVTAAGGSLLVVSPGDVAALDALDVPASALPALTRDLDNGYALVLPEGPLPDGTDLAWWRVDTRTGETLGVTAAGRGQDATEEAELETLIGVSIIGVVAGLLISEFLKPCWRLTGEAYRTCMCKVGVELALLAGLGAGLALGLAGAVVVSVVVVIGTLIFAGGTNANRCESRQALLTPSSISRAALLAGEGTTSTRIRKRRRSETVDRRRTWFARRLAAAVIAGLAFLGASVATAQQFTVTGTVTGTLAGEERTWYALEYQSQAEEGADGTSWLRNMGFGPVTLLSFEVEAHAQQAYGIEGTLLLSGMLGSLDCPCVADEVDIRYISTPSMLEDVYAMLEGELVVATLEMSDDGTYRVTGTFRALLGHVEDLRTDEPDPEQTIEVAGEFALDRVLSDEGM